MAAAVTCTPTAPVAKQDFCRIDVTGAAENDAAAYDTAVYPTEPQIKCYLRFVKGGVEYGRSYIFAVAADGTHSFPNYMFPSSGAWTVTLCRSSNDAVLATKAVTVS